MQNRDPMELNFEVLEMQKWNIPTHRVDEKNAQRINEKNRIICLVVMLTPRVKVIKMSKKAHCLSFQQKIGHSLSKIFKASERSYGILSKNGIVIMFRSYSSWDIERRNIKNLSSEEKKHRNPVFSRVDILLMVAQKPVIHSVFWTG